MEENKVKILYVITKGNWGGAQKYVYELASSLTSNAGKPTGNFEVTVALGEGEKLAEELRAINIRVIKLPRSIRDIKFLTDIGLFFDLVDLFRREQPQVIHLNSSKIGVLGALAARAARAPKIIFTAHGWAFNEERPDWQKLLIKIIHWITVIVAHQTICVARREYNQMASWPGTKKKLSVIYNGQGEINFKPAHEARQFLLSRIPAGINLPETVTWIGTIAELHKNKGLDYAIEAIKLFSQNNPEQPILFFIIGEGEERGNLEKLIAENSLQNNVFLLGQINDAKTYLKAFDIFTLTSRKEGLPYSLLEAGLAALPVIASDVGGIREIIDETTGLLVRAGHPKEIKIALEKLVYDSKLRQALGQSLKTRVERDFSLEQMIEKTIELYCGPTNSLWASPR